MFLSIIIPCYNEAAQISKTVRRIIGFMYCNNYLIKDFEIILVNDGSTDETFAVFENITHKYNNVIPVSYRINHGKGYAVKTGIGHAHGDVIIFMDADLSTQLNAINAALAFIKYKHLKQFMIIGSRYTDGANILQKQNFLRRHMSQICVKFVNWALKLHVTDSQCGFKCFDKSTAKLFMDLQTVNGWAFDAEYLRIARLYDIEILEAPVVWSDDKSSTVKPFWSALSYIKDVKRIKNTDYKK